MRLHINPTVDYGTVMNDFEIIWTYVSLQTEKKRRKALDQTDDIMCAKRNSPDKTSIEFCCNRPLSERANERRICYFNMIYHVFPIKMNFNQGDILYVSNW